MIDNRKNSLRVEFAGIVESRSFPADSDSLWATILNGLSYKDRDKELNFGTFYLQHAREGNRIALLFGTVLMYIFFVWDFVIDPKMSDYTHAIRGLLFLPVSIVLLVLLSLRKFSEHLEVITVIFMVWSASCLSLIYWILEDGWMYGAVGIVMTFAWAGSMVRVRFFKLFYSLLIVTFVALCSMLLSNNLSLPMIGINMLCILSTGIGSSVGIINRELSERKRFDALIDLDAAQVRIRDFEYGLRTSTASSNRSKYIFISYRRADTEAITGRLRDRLAVEFGSDFVFMDVDNIPIGVDFREHIRGAIRSSDVFLCVMGNGWLSSGQNGVTRLTREEDPIRLEIEAAIEFGLTIIPVLIGKAEMPKESELPDQVKPIAFLNAAQIDTGRDFHIHVDRLIEAIRRGQYKTAQDDCV